ncbi:bifunctional glutamate N-acetyltransferase/amino-acid acetyltransferase ArgJ [candidate division KSB1 bacterium]|nr:bifunctional glutamate N-acetyltransferase/amino-acid acetyltransferase ArgJ [candidate division KSB1 bacterium]
MSGLLKTENGTITTPKGFKACGIRAGIKKQGTDMALVFSEAPCAAVGLFTTNKIKAAPVDLSRRHLQNGRASAIIINSGNANACTGGQGEQDAGEMAGLTAGCLDIAETDVLVASTGIIGHKLPMDKIRTGIKTACQSLAETGGEDAARAIMTTDTVPKHASVSFEIDGVLCHIGGMAKGAGMICPNMATLIAVFTTDVAIDKKLLYDVLQQTAAVSFNSLTVDGETSTNDCLFFLANGMAGNTPITGSGTSLEVFSQAMMVLTVELTKKLARDGEGATKLVTVTVEGASDAQQAQRAARAVADSLLVKTAIYGKDPNWGRVVSAVGSCGVDLDPAALAVRFAGIPVLEKGHMIDFPQDLMAGKLLQQEIEILVSLGAGDSKWSIYTCDLTHEYITINAEYHT